jgi:DNA-directed RNA polymerase subunit RPC12/RpoP
VPTSRARSGRKSNAVPTVLTRTCADCGDEFQQERVGPGQPRKWCDRCKTLRSLSKIGQPVVKDCARCGEPFEQVNRNVKPFIYCEPCRAEAHADYIARKRKSERAKKIERGYYVQRVCEDCSSEFLIQTTSTRHQCPPCRGKRSRARRAAREAERLERGLRPILVTHGMNSLVAQRPAAAAWYAHLREQLLQWDEAFKTPLEMYAMTMARIESGYRWVEEQREAGAEIKDLLAVEAQLDTQMRIAIKLAHELGLTPRSAISMAKDAGTAHELRRRSAIDRVNQHLLGRGSGEAA